MHSRGYKRKASAEEGYEKEKERTETRSCRTNVQNERGKGKKGQLEEHSRNVSRTKLNCTSWTLALSVCQSSVDALFAEQVTAAVDDDSFEAEHAS